MIPGNHFRIARSCIRKSDRIGVRRECIAIGTESPVSTENATEGYSVLPDTHRFRVRGGVRKV